MKRLLFYISVVMLCSFKDYQERRVLMIFADHGDNKQLKQQLTILNADKAGLNDRDISIQVLYADKEKKTFYSKRIKSPFGIILIGKDGGEKLRAASPVTLTKLYSLIDAMPMRQREMRERP